MTAHHNHWDTLAQWSESSSSITSSFDTEIAALKAEMAEIKKNLMRVLQFMKMNTASSLGSRTLPVERETEATKDTVYPTNNGSSKDVQPSVVLTESPILNFEPVIAPIIEPVVSPVSALKPNQRPLIPYPSRLQDQKLRDKSLPIIRFLVQLGLLKMSSSKWEIFLKTRRALIDVFEGELTLCVGKEAITFNLNQTSRYSANYNDMTANRIDVIDMACKEYSQEVLGFFDVIASGNPTPYYDAIVSTTFLTLTLFENSDFLLKEVDAILALEDDPTSTEVDQSYVDTEGDILLLEAFINDDPSLPPPNQGNYFPHVRKELKIGEAKFDKSSIDEPPEEKTALIKVSKSHMRAIAWKLSNIKGVYLEFLTHKILMEEDFEPAVQHQRRVNPKIHDVIKNEVLKILDVGLIYPISDSPWVSPVYCVPKMGGFTVVENEENELILTRLVTGWHVCIDYRPTIPTTTSPVVERETEATKDTMHPTNNGSTEDVQPPVVLTESPILNSEPVISPIIEPVASLNKLSLPDLSPTCMTLELADRSISHPVGVAEEVFVKVGTFHFPADFVVIDFDANPRVPLILERSFLKTKRALIDVFEGELTLRVGKEAITFNLDQTLRYSANYNDMTANRIDVIDMACEEYSQEVLGFFDVIASGNPTPYYDPIVSTTSPTLTPFENSDFLLEEVDAFLAFEDDPTLSEVDQSYVDSERDILLLEAFLNDDPSLPPQNQGNYLPQVELKDLPPHLEYIFLEGDDKLPVIIVKDLSVEEKTALITVLKSHKRAIAWKLSDIKGIDPEFCTHKILMEEDFKPVVQHQRRVNPKIHDVIKNEALKLIDAGLIYPISDSPWEKTIFICPYRTFAYRRMPFGLCNASGTFQRCMMAIFHDMIEKTMEVFMDDFSVFRNSFQTCLSHLEKMLKRFKDTNLCLNWEKSHFMVKEGIVLGHKISKEGIEVDKAKADVITKLTHPKTVKGICSFLFHASFYRRFIQDFSKIARPMTRILKKDTSFLFSKDCFKAFQILKRKLTEAPILIAPDWDIPFELMCDASDFAIGVVLGQRQEKHFRPIHYASKTMTEAESNYTTTEKKMLAVVYAFEKFRSYLIKNKSILFAKKDSKARLLRWVLLLQEFTFKLIDTKEAENLAADHLS
nr:reverse transcriptase domain-containing protein [Tanacetum cinerariifolium]